MRYVALLLLVLAPALAAADPDQQRQRTRIIQTLDLVESLHLDNATTQKLLPVLSAYTRERDRLLDEYNEAERRLGSIRDPQIADQLLDDMLATQSALVASEAKVVVRLRRMLPADQAASARVMLADQQLPRTATASGSPVATGYDPEALFPPGSAIRVTCDPFASMHGCRY